MAEFLASDDRVAWFHYCGLPSDSNYELGQKYLPNGSCGVMAFGLKGDRETAVKFMDSLELVRIVTHVADSRTCVLHPASHTHRQLSDEQLKEAEDKGASADELREILGKAASKRGIFEGDLDGGELEIGQIASGIKQIESAEEIVCRIMAEYEDTRKRLL